MGRIVVGLDASENSLRALRWAREEAELRGAELQLVHAFPTPEIVALPAIVTMPSDEEMYLAAEGIIDEALAAVDGAGDVPVSKVVRAGGTAAVLCDVAEGADMIVVGARGLGGFRGLLLGSVTHAVVAHAPCPVVVTVPEQR